MDYIIFFEDMKKYNPSFSEEQVEGKTDDEIRDMFKDFYAENLPVDLLTWMRVYEPMNQMIYKPGYWDQAVFVRDKLNSIFYPTYKDCIANPVKVIGTHHSKSIVLPVYYIYVNNTKIIMRYNFYDWKVSIDSKHKIDGISDFLFQEDKPIPHIYCEGFNEDQVFGIYKDNNNKFTVELSSSYYKLYTFFYLLNKSLRNK